MTRGLLALSDLVLSAYSRENYLITETLVVYLVFLLAIIKCHTNFLLVCGVTAIGSLLSLYALASLYTPLIIWALQVQGTAASFLDVLP